MKRSATAILAARSICAARGEGIGERDVGRHGVAEEEVFLEDDADVPPQVVDVDAARVDAVDQHASLGGIEEAGKEVQEGGLAFAGRTQHGDALARPDAQRDVAEHETSRLVGEGNVVELDFPPRHAQVNRRGKRADLDGGVENLEHSSGPGQALLDAVDDARDLAYLAGELLEQAGEDDQSAAQSQLPADDQITPVAQEHNQVAGHEELDRGREKAHAPEDPLLLVADGGVHGAELLQFLRLAAEASDDLHPADVLGEREQQAVDQVAIVVVGRSNGARESDREPTEQGRRGETGERESDMNTQHVGQIAEERKPEDCHLKDDAVDEQTHRLHVSCYPVEQRTARVLAVEPRAELLKLGIHRRTKVDDDFALKQLCNVGCVAVVQRGADQRQHKYRARQQGGDGQRVSARRGAEQQPLRWVDSSLGVVNDPIEGPSEDAQAGHAQPKRGQLHGYQTHTRPTIARGKGEHAAEEYPVGRRGGGHGKMEGNRTEAAKSGDAAQRENGVAEMGRKARRRSLPGMIGELCRAYQGKQGTAPLLRPRTVTISLQASANGIAFLRGQSEAASPVPPLYAVRRGHLGIAGAPSRSASLIVGLEPTGVPDRGIAVARHGDNAAADGDQRGARCARLGVRGLR